MEAERSLEEVEEIVVIGYSLPTTDFASETLLRIGIKGSMRNKIPVTIVNPDPKVAQRFSRIFNPKTITSIKNFDEYLRAIT